MGYDSMWMLRVLTPVQMDLVRPRFQEATRGFVLSPEAQAALALWHRDPNAFGARHPSNPLPGHSELFGDFELIFTPQSLDDLACDLWHTDNEIGFDYDEATCVVVVLNRMAPAALFYYAIGPDRADGLPGYYGNLLVEAADVPRVYAQVKEALDAGDAERKVWWNRAKLWMPGNNDADEAIPKVLSALPDGLERALAARQGLVSVVSLLS
jgi:hypothetical protein